MNNIKKAIEDMKFLRDAYDNLIENDTDINFKIRYKELKASCSLAIETLEKTIK